jgi:Large polyvalent protein associated domain 38
VIQATVKRMLGAHAGADDAFETGLDPAEIRSALLEGSPLDAFAAKHAQVAYAREHGDLNAPGTTSAPKPPGPLSRLQAEHGGLGRASLLYPMAEVADLAGASLGQSVIRPAVGLFARAVSTLNPDPVIREETSSTARDIRSTLDRGFEGTRGRFLEAHPSGAGPAVALGIEFAAQSVPFAPGVVGATARIGRGAATLAGRFAPETFEAGSAGARLLTHAAGGGAFGGVLGLGNADPDAPLAEQARQIGMSAGLGAAMGGLGGAREVAGMEAQGAFYPSGQLRHGPPPPTPEVRAQLLQAFEMEKQQATQEAALNLPADAPSPEPIQAAVQQVEARWQPIFAKAGAAGDEHLAALADQTQEVVAPVIKAPPIPEVEQRANLPFRREVQEAINRLKDLPDDALADVQASTASRAEEIAVERIAFTRRAGTHYGPPGEPPPPAASEAPPSAEAGFLRVGRNKPPAPPPSPIEAVMPRNEPAAPPGGLLGRLQSIADKVTDQLFNREDAPVRRMRRAGMVKEAEYLFDLQARARGAGGMIDPAHRAGPVYEGTYVYDPTIRASRRTGDGLQAVVGGMDDQALYDLDALLVSQRHMELVGRKEAAQLQYDWQRAQRLEEMRQARQADKESLRSMAGNVRTKQATALQAARQEARARGEYGAFLTSEGRMRRAAVGRPALQPAEVSTDLAARRIGSAAPPATQARTDALGAIRSGQRVAMGVRDAATRRIPPVERPPDIDLSIDGRGTAAARQTLADLEARYGPGLAQLQDVAQRFRDWTIRAWMIPLKEAGRFSDREFTYQQKPDGSFTYGGDIIAKNDMYAPFQRLMEVLGDEDVYGLAPVTSGKPNPMHAISGGLSPDLPTARPVQSAVEMAQKATLWTERQRVRNTFADAVDSSPELQREIRKLSPTGGAGMGPKTNLPIHVRGNFPAWRDGARSDYTAPPDVLRAVETLSPKQAGFVMEAAKLAARMLRAGATITLEFPFRNLGRDVQDAAVYGPGFNPVYKVLVDPFAGLLQSIKGGKWEQEWRANGGALSGAVAVGRPQLEALVRDVARPQTVGSKIGRRFRAEIGGDFGQAVRQRPATTLLKSGLFPFMAPLESLASTMESASKVGAYRRMRLRGMAPGEAAAISRDVSSPDFGRAGTFGQAWNQVEAFSNAELQDLYRLGRAFRRNPGTTTIKAMAFLTLPAIANWAKNKDDPNYQDLPEWERVAFYHPVKLDNGRWVRIPRPLGLINLAFSYGPQKLLEKMHDEDPDATEEFTRALVDQTPLHFLPQMENLRGGGRMDWLPTGVQPLAEVAAGPGGYSGFRQAPIVPQGLQDQLPEDQVRDQTSGVARAVGGAMGTSPLKIDYLIQGYGATWGRMIAQGTAPAARVLGADPSQDTFAGRMAQGGSPQLPTQPSDIPGVRGFVSTPAIGFASDPVTRLYALSTEAAQAKASLKEALDSGDVNRYQSIMREHPEVVLSEPLLATRKQLTDLRKQRNDIMSNPGYAPEQRLDMILLIDQAASAIAGAQMTASADYLRGAR